MTNHYVEDLDATFRFDYSPEFIEWCVIMSREEKRSRADPGRRRALKPPGYFPDWHVGIRVADTGKLVGFISGIPLDLRIRNACVHEILPLTNARARD